MKVDLIIKNARIYTVNKNFVITEAMAVKDGKVFLTGNTKTVESQCKADEVIDAGGLTIFPGFIDPHCHFKGYGQMLTNIDLTATTSYNDILARLVKYNNKDYTYWIKGRGWDQNQWEDKSIPIKDKLDRLFPHNPVFLLRIDGHAALVNQKALDISGITLKSVVEGGRIVSENGQLTGLLIDKAMEPVMDKIPELTDAQQESAIQLAAEHCYRVGLTTVSDAGLDRDEVLLIDRMHKNDLLKMRLYAMLLPSPANEERFIKSGTYRTDYLNVCSVKLYADGALGSGGAFLLKPYSNQPTNSGFLLHDRDYFYNWAKKCFEAGYQLNVHAIGDGANRFILNIFGEILKKKNNRRWRIEHAQIVHPDDLQKFRRFTVIPSVQATHSISDMKWAVEALGKDRIKYAYAYRDLMAQNGLIANGSDFPVEDINPLLGFYAAIQRKDPQGKPYNGFQPKNALTRVEALQAMTIWAAYANFEERVKGSLDPGKYADFVLLDKDIMTIEADEIPAVKVMATFINGTPVYINNNHNQLYKFL